MKKYGVIIADPPWAYANGAHVRGGADLQYPTMSYKELAALPIKNLAATDAVMLMWTTWPMLQDAGLPLLRTWGFTYITGFPWIKVTSIQSDLWGDIKFKTKMGVGYWARGVTEIVLIGKKGNASPPTESFIGLLSPNLYHSRKPDDLYEYAESLPGPYLELFARRTRVGWDVWGNQVDGIDIEVKAENESCSQAV